MDDQAIIAHTCRWIESVVIGLNLCPFAGRVFFGCGVRYVVTDARDERSLLGVLAEELAALAAARHPGIETTLLIHPHALTKFDEYNDFLDRIDQLLEDRHLTGTIQVASFHPAYQFADTAPDAVENYTNRSPYPMLHLLREDSITEVATDEEQLHAIPERNIATLRAMGLDRVREMLRGLEGGAEGIAGRS